ncbi:MAG: hypothetical protein SGCHY_005446 [Lobulomycetales sp.]
MSDSVKPETVSNDISLNPLAAPAVNGESTAAKEAVPANGENSTRALETLVVKPTEKAVESKEQAVESKEQAIETKEQAIDTKEESVESKQEFVEANEAKAVTSEKQAKEKPSALAPLTIDEKDRLVGVLDILSAQSIASPFLVPVDHVALGLEDYPKVCPNPMDISTIRGKLSSADTPASLDMITKDFHLMVENARRYNPAPHAIHTAAMQLYNALKDALSKAGFKHASLPELEILAKRPARKVHKPVKYAAELEAISTALPAKRKMSARSPTSATKRRPPAVKRLSEAQISDLSAAIAGLPQSALDQVVVILADHIPEKADVDEEREFELDLDSLDSATLRDLYRFVKSVAGSGLP